MTQKVYVFFAQMVPNLTRVELVNISSSLPEARDSMFGITVDLSQQYIESQELPLILVVI
jgi:hypothetical protein